MAKGKDTDTRDSLTTGKAVADSNNPAATMSIEHMIFTIRGVQVMVDRDLAMLYGVATRVMNQTIKRNIDRFPERYRFQLSENETNELVTNCDRINTLKHSSVIGASLKDLGHRWLAFAKMEIVATELMSNIH